MMVSRSPFFDAAWYLATNPDVAAAGLDPVEHYLLYGGMEGRAASPAFHSAAYLADNPDVMQCGMNPLVHYLRHGAAEGRAAPPLGRDEGAPPADLAAEAPTGTVPDQPTTAGDVEAVPADGVQQAPAADAEDDRTLVLRSSFFDAAWYLETNPDVAAAGFDPVEHYLLHGGREGRAASPVFHSAIYFSDNPDIAESGLNPLVHYLRHGAAEGRAAPPVGPAAGEAVGGAVAEASSEPVLDPRPAESTSPDAAASPLPGTGSDGPVVPSGLGDAATGGSHPSATMTADDGRAASAADSAGAQEAQQAPAPEGDDDWTLVLRSSLFDAAWYLETNPDVAAAGLDPVEHYLLHGGREGRAASPVFHSAIYLSDNPDIAESGLNPLVHYLRHGAAEGRAAPSVDRAPAASAAPSPVADASVGAIVDPSPSDPFSPEAARLLVQKSKFFDIKWYRSRYGASIPPGMQPIDHYVAFGGAGEVDPGPKFDARFYLGRYPDVAAAGVNPLVHYLLFGKDEGRKIRSVRDGEPASVSSTAPEKASRPIAAQGSPEGGAVAAASGGPTSAVAAVPTAVAAPAGPAAAEPPSSDAAADPEALALVKSTPLFDPVWYLIQYPDVARSRMDPAEHFLRHGGPERRRPSLFFDPDFYVEQSPSLAGFEGNPLVHFLKEGRAAGLKPSAILDFAAPSRRVADADGPASVLLPTSADASAPEPIAWTRHADVAFRPDEDALVVGTVKVARVTDPAPVRAGWHTLSAFARLVAGGAQPVDLRLDSNRDGEVVAVRVDATTPICLGSRFTSGPGALADLWHAADGVMRLRFGPEATPPDPMPAVIRAFQADLARPERLRLVGEGPVGTGPALVDLVLDSPYAPVLLVVTTPDGRLLDCGLLPFPSLARGGAHAGEAETLSKESGPLEDFRTLSEGLLRELFGWDDPSAPDPVVSRIRVGLDGALGSERILVPAMGEWLRVLFGIGLEGAAGSESTHLAGALASAAPSPGVPDPGRRGADGAILDLSADCIPTLSALVGRRITRPAVGGCRVGAVIVADDATARPLGLVSLPAFPPDFRALQPRVSPSTAPFLSAPDAGSAAPLVGRAEIPLAIRFPVTPPPNDASLLMPTAPDDPDPVLVEGRAGDGPVTVILLDAGHPHAGAALSSVLRQRGLVVGDVFAVTSGSKDAAVETLAGAAGAHLEVIRSTGDLRRDLAAALASTTADRVLVVDGAAVLHDPRTFETLSTLLAHEGVASAACGRLRETMARRGTVLKTANAGYFPVAVSLLAAPRLILGMPNVYDLLPAATYPVIANDLVCTLLRSDLLRRHVSAAGVGFTGGRFDLHFGLATVAEGWHHLCTTAVRVTSLRAEAAQEHLDPLGAQVLGPERWDGLLADVTLVREFR